MFGPEGLWLHDYPYAQDGLNLWGALLGYFTDYLGLYYSGDADVAGDSELQAWWRECKVRPGAAREVDADAQLHMCGRLLVWQSAAKAGAGV
jgi:hypothetical protein